MSVAPPALALEHISRNFGPVAALRDASLHVEAGHVHALLGENGAGKTTLMHVAFGMVSADRGVVRMNGAPVTINAPSDAIAAGIGMVHQHFTLVPAMTVAENIALGGRGLLRHGAMVEAVRDIAAATGFALDPDALVETLSVGAQQRVEIAKALARRARVLILDEPTAVLAPAEAEELLRWARRFADAGNAVVLITHKLHEALGVADRVTVLRQGQVVHTGAAAEASVQTLAGAMLGADAPARHETLPPPTRAGNHRRATVASDATAILAAHHVTVHDERGRARLRDASLVVRAGEIVGLAGVEGGGQWELLRALAGRIDVRAGRIERPTQVGFVPEDRHRDAVLLDRSLTDNAALRGAGGRRGRISWRTLRTGTRSLMDEFDVRAPSTETVMRTLSGGNQQKFVLAREMTTLLLRGRDAPSDARAIVIENPTRGLDVRATAEVHARLRAARDDGAAVLVYSSDLDEVLALADRVAVVHAGTVRDVPADRDVIGRAMLGAA
ncbi:MAG TPA: ATP-binding cassette domain-containing protein [Gemmatimonadaceae bacterium]|nr:ATP-binding cassette domain-containing protein [Gemmatimonadaceae bacterium]